MFDVFFKIEVMIGIFIIIKQLHYISMVKQREEEDRLDRERPRSEDPYNAANDLLGK